jgi:glycosyltransferase involved in cell wall biosynthesis
LLTNPAAATELDPSIWFALVIAVFLGVIAIKSRWNQLSLPEIEHRPPGEAPPDCMVVIPARSEERIITRAVKSLPRDSVIVVDDASEDKTAEVAERAGAGVVKAPRLLRGMVGKANACTEGARLLTSQWILFADADTWYEPGFLESAIATADAAKVDFLSIYLRPVYESFAARLLAPYAVALFFFGVNPRANAVEAFNGQCILVKRGPYEFVGGHGAIRQHLNDDLKLAALALRHRMKIGVARTSDLGRARMDPESFRRGAQRFGIADSWSGVRIMLAALAFFLWAPAALWLMLDGHRYLAAGLAVWPIIILSFWYGAKLALLAPFGILGLTPTLISAMLHVLMGRRVAWKGRII